MINYLNQKKLLLIFSLLFFIIALPAMAANLGDAFGGLLKEVAGPEGAGYTYSDPDSLIGNIIAAALSFLGVIFLALMIYGGYLWMTARGNEPQVNKAKDLITAAVIGVIIVLAAYAISYWIIQTVGTNTLAEP